MAALKGLPDEKIGGATIRIISHGGGYRGCIIRDGKVGDIIEQDDLAALRAWLRNEAGKLHPNYVGMDGATDRFPTFLSVWL